MEMSTSEMDQIPDVPIGGPLHEYRSKASFNWKKLKLFFEDFELYKFKENIWNTLKNDPLFARPIEDPPMKVQKEIAHMRVKKLNEYAFITLDDFYSNPMKRVCFEEAVILWDPSMSIKFNLNFQFFIELLRRMGTERHAYMIHQAEESEIFGCFALTEMKHGSNTREIQTTARYDPKTQEFIINTPTFEDSKVWVGNLGKTATHAAVYAQLITPDNVCHGMHIFIVPVRDCKTMRLLPGCIVGDMGAKAGLNGIDNGFATFNQVRIPRENLLNRTADVTPDGKYVSPIKDPSKRFGINLGALSNGRVGLTYHASCFMSVALTIAIRYSFVRKQFGPSVGNEISIMEYQLHQYRLMPSLALTYMWKHFASGLFCDLVEFLMGLMAKDRSEKQSDFGKEIHALSCASKAVSSWAAHQIIQECREACGGNGYLKAARFGDLRNCNDPLMTFEGDNNVLLQQTSNYLLSAYEDFLSTKVAPETPLNTLGFLNRLDSTLSLTFTASTRPNLLNNLTIMQMFDWLLCFMVKKSHDKLNQSLKTGKDSFTARNDNQVFYSKTLAIIFIERQIVERFIKKVSPNIEPSIKAVVERLLHLGALQLLEKYISIFYQGGYFTGEAPALLIRHTIIELCGEMKNDALGVVDAMAPPDYVINSALGDASGEAYKNIYTSLIESNGSFDRIDYLDNYLKKSSFGSLRSKI